MDYSNIDKVAKAIMGYDRNLGMTFYNLPTDIGNAFGESFGGLKESKYSDAKNKLNELALRSAVETLLILKKNERDLAEEKADELWHKYAAIPEEKRDEKADAYELYDDTNDLVKELDADCAEIENHILAVFQTAIDAPFNH